MSQPDGFSPSYPGTVTALGFVSTGATQTTTRSTPQRISVHTNGTTEVDVFGTVNPFSGTFVGARIISKNDANGNVTLQHTSGATVVFTIAKGSEGGVKGSAFTATAFAAGATATIKSSTSTGNAIVEIDFVVSDPKRPGAQ